MTEQEKLLQVASSCRRFASNLHGMALKAHTQETLRIKGATNELRGELIDWVEIFSRQPLLCIAIANSLVCCFNEFAEKTKPVIH
jgi:hypothetical protein